MENFKINLVGEWDEVLSNREEPQTADVLGANRETLVKCLKAVRACSSKNVTWLIVQLKCLYIDACSIDNKQEKLEDMVQLES